jgi:hypothetical protein
MKRAKLHVWPIIALFLLMISACGGGGGGSDGGGTGTLSLALTDSSCSGYKAIYVTIDEVHVKRNDSSSNGNSGWRIVARPMKTYNLLKLVNGVTEVLGEDELKAGAYQQIRLMIGKTPESENNINGEPHPHANYLVLNDDSYENLKIPSGLQTGVKLVHNFSVDEDSFVELVLDFEACKSVVETGSGKYILKPTIKVIETVDKTIVYGVVNEADTEPLTPIPVRASVSAQISEGFSASVVRSTLTSDLAEYSLLLSPGQTYNIVVYSEGKIEGQLYSPACSEVTVPLNTDLMQDFSLVKSEFGTISGEVFFSGPIDSTYPPVVHISFYSALDCGYVEVMSRSMSPDEDSGICAYEVDLPVGVYDVVASSEGFIPDTESAVDLTTSGETETVRLLELEEQSSSQ